MTTIRVRRDDMAELVLESVRPQLNVMGPGDYLVIRVPKGTIGALDSTAISRWLNQWNASARWLITVDAASRCVIVHQFPRPSYEDPMDDWD